MFGAEILEEIFIILEKKHYMTINGNINMKEVDLLTLSPCAPGGPSGPG